MKTAAFKNTDIGPIPADWEVKEIANIAPLQRGFDLPTTSIEDGPYPVVYSNGILAHHTIGPCKAPGIITGRSGTIGSFLFVENGRYWPHNTTLWVTSFCGNDPKFVFYLYSHIGFDRFSGGTGVPTLNRNDVHVFKTAIPPSVSEQRRIAAALSDTDELVASLDKLIEKKKRVKEGAMQRLLSGETRLPGFSGKKVKQTDLGPIPADWEVKRLGELGNTIRGVSYKPEQSSQSAQPAKTILLRANNIQKNALSLDSVVYVSDECIDEKQFLRDEDILICSANGSRALVGKSAIVEQATKMTFGAFMAVLRCNSSACSRYIGYLLQSYEYRRQLDDILSGSAINNLNGKDIERLAFSLPQLREQRAIAAVLSDMDAEIAALSRERVEAERIKQGMMQELLTGKTRLAEGE